MVQAPLASLLTQFIPLHATDENAGRVALYHYLKNFCREEEILQPDLINQFFAECLQMPHWQEKKLELYNDIKELLAQFCSKQRIVMALDQLWDLGKMQIVTITQPENLYQIVKNYENHRLTELETLRIVPDSESRMISIRKNSAGTICVRTFNNVVRVTGHELQPFCPDQELFYNPLLELQTQVVHRLQLAPHLQVRFEINEDSIIAQSISGSAFRQGQISKLAHLGEFSALFYHLKRLERFYIYRQSDPYYVELVSTIDKAMNLLHGGEAGAETFSRHVFESAQIAFDQIFPDDKALYLKLKELARAMTNQSKRPEEVIP